MNTIETLEARIAELEVTNQILASQNLLDLYQSLSEDYNKLQARVTQILEFIEAQAEELAKYKQLATTAIDDAVALRAQLAALQCEDELLELPSPSELNGASNSVMGFTEADLKAYARQAQAMVRAKMVPLTGEQILNHEIWRQHAGHSYREKVEIVRAIEAAHNTP